MLSVFRNFFSFQGVPLSAVLITAAISYILQINSILSGDPLYIIAFVTLLPWIPLFIFEGVWKIEHYAMVAALGLFTVLQLGHFAEHLIQVIQLQYLDGTVACPPPIDNIENSKRAIEHGLRAVGSEPTFYSVDQIMKPGPDGFGLKYQSGEPIVGPAACAVFGQLDLEVVHLIWELLGYAGTAAMVYFFPRNVFLWIALLGLSWHALEHLTITYFYYFDQAKNWDGLRQLWATVQVSGNIYQAVPVGLEPTKLNFYDAGGKFGLMADNGLFEQMTGYNGMPGRAVLHMGYNAFITVPTVLGFLVEARRIYNQYLAKAFSRLKPDELTDISMKLTPVSFSKNEAVITQGDAADACYIITKGNAEVKTGKGERAKSVASLGSGQYFGEIGLVEGKRRSASVIAQSALKCLKMDAATFKQMTDNSSAIRKDIERLIERRRND